MASPIDRIAFNPAARPIDTVGIDTSFQRMAAPVNTTEQVMAPTPPAPVNKPYDTSAETKALVTALTAFGTSIGGLFTELGDKQKDEDTVSGAFAAMTRSEATWGEAVRADPSLAGSSPWFRQAFSSSLAKTAVSKRALQMQSEYYTSPMATSTDPASIQKWYIDGMKDTLAQYTDADTRKAAMEAAKEYAEKFTAVHMRNATGNLLQQADRATTQGMATALDAAEANPHTVPLPARGDIALKGATPAQRAFLMATASGESPSYDIRYGGIGSSGKNFDINGPHPGIMELTGRKTKDGNDEKSSASGKYQFVITTWKGIWNGLNPVMTPENQDKAALFLAQKDYAQRTGGRDLWKDIETQGFNSTIQSVLAPTWTSFNKSQARRSALFNQELQRGGGQVSTSPDARPSYDEAASKVFGEREKAIAAGQGIDKTNQNTVQAVVAHALKTGDDSYLSILDRQTSDGLVLSKDPSTQQTIQQTRERLNNLKIARENHKRQTEEHAKKAAVERLTQQAFSALETNFARSQDMKLTPEERREAASKSRFDSETLLAANKVSFSLVEKMLSMNKNMDDRSKEEDVMAVTQASMRLYSGEMQTSDVWDLVANQTLKNPVTINRFLEQAKQNRSETYLGSTVFRNAMQDIDTVFGDPMNISLKKAQQKVDARGELRQEYVKWMKENPKATPDQQADFLFTSTKAILGRTQNIAAWKRGEPPPGAEQPAPGTSQPAPVAPQAPAPKPGMSAPAAAPFVPPSRNVDTNSTFVFGSVTELDGAFQLWRSKPDQPGPFNYWLKAAGISDKKQAVQWYLKQKALAGTQR